MTLEERKKLVLDNIKRETWPPRQVGGQTCGMPTRGIKLTSEELGASITIECYRNQIQNLELAYTLMGLIIDEQVK